MKTYTSIIEEVAQFYSEDPSRRAKDDAGICCYLTDDGRKCAVGRYLSDPEKFRHARCNAENLLLNASIQALMPEVQHLKDTDFWQRLQRFHDDDRHWILTDYQDATSRKLTTTGEAYLRQLKFVYANR